MGVGTKTITITGEGFVPASVARINGSNRATTFIDSSHLLLQITGNDTNAYASNGGFFITVYNPAPGGGYSNGVFFAVNNTNNYQNSYDYSNNTASSFSDTNTNGGGSYQTQNQNVAPAQSGNDNSNPASNAIFGSNSFTPSGLIQWVFFAILVLLIVILVRKSTAERADTTQRL